jgi:hypothetical protein
VVAWLVETVLMGGSAMNDDVPFGRVRPLRQRVARQIKAAIGGTVTTALISPTTIVVYSAWVIDGRTEDQRTESCTTPCSAFGPAKQEFRSAKREWRRSWSQVATTPGR